MAPLVYLILGDPKSLDGLSGLAAHLALCLVPITALYLLSMFTVQQLGGTLKGGRVRRIG